MFIEKDLYIKILEVMPIPTLDILFLNSKNQLLLGKRVNEPLHWVFYIPWGRINKWETLLNAAKRKSYEELGLDIDIARLKFLWIYDDIFDNSAFEWVNTHCIPTTYYYQLNQEEEKNLNLGDGQHTELQFFDLEDSWLHKQVLLRIKDLKNYIY